MQKKIIALALAGLASSAAFAQSNVTIYGRADYGFMSRGGNINAAQQDTRNEFGSGLQSGSRLGFKGSEDLGNGLKAIFQYEFGLGMDQNTSLNSTRNAYVGLTGNFGTVVGGRLDGVRYGIFGKYDAFANGTVANFTQMTAQVDRANNAIAYISPNLSGFTLTLAAATHIGNSNPLGLAADEAGAPVGLGTAASTGNGNKGDARLTTIALNYANGPLDLTADWERVSHKEGANVGTVQGTVDNVTVYTLAGSYDFGVAKVAALYDNLKIENFGGATAADVDSWFVSASAPVGKFVFKTTYGQTKNDVVANSKAKKFGIGADYNLSKRTNLYANFARISNDTATAFGISPLGNGLNAGANLYGERGFDIGIAHKF